MSSWRWLLWKLKWTCMLFWEPTNKFLEVCVANVYTILTNLMEFIEYQTDNIPSQQYWNQLNHTQILSFSYSPKLTGFLYLPGPGLSLAHGPRVVEEERCVPCGLAWLTPPAHPLSAAVLNYFLRLHASQNSKDKKNPPFLSLPLSLFSLSFFLYYTLSVIF